MTVQGNVFAAIVVAIVAAVVFAVAFLLLLMLSGVLMPMSTTDFPPQILLQQVSSNNDFLIF